VRAGHLRPARSRQARRVGGHCASRTVARRLRVSGMCHSLRDLSCNVKSVWAWAKRPPLQAVSGCGCDALRRTSPKSCRCRQVDDFLRRKSLPGRVIHRISPRAHHPARRGQYVTVTQWRAGQARPTKTTNRHSAGPRGGGALSDTSTYPGSNQSGHAYELHDLASRWCGHQRARSLSPDAARSSVMPISHIMSSCTPCSKICCAPACLTTTASSPSDKVLKNLPRIGPFLRSSVVRSQTAVVPPSTINSIPLT
jgi:hypothetical protein